MLNFANASSGFIFSESFATRFFYQQWIQVQSSSEPMQLHKAIGALQFWKPRSLKFKKSRCWWPFGWMHLLGGEAKWPKYLSGFVFALSYMDEYRSIVYSTIPGPHGGDGSFCFFSDRLGCETVKSWFLDRLVAGSMRELSEIATKSGPQRACPYHVCVSNENPQDASVNNIVHMYIYIYIYPLSPHWFWHVLFAASSDLPSHNSDTRLSKACEFLRRNSDETFPKPTEGVKLSKNCPLLSEACCE